MQINTPFISHIYFHKKRENLQNPPLIQTTYTRMNCIPILILSHRIARFYIIINNKHRYDLSGHTKTSSQPAQSNCLLPSSHITFRSLSGDQIPSFFFIPSSL